MNTGVGVRTETRPLALVELLAHELRQPLSAIESSAYYLGMVLPRGEKRAQEQATQVRRLVEQADWMISCALQLADASPLAPTPLDLEELIAQCSMAQSLPGSPGVRLELAGDLPAVRLDPARARAFLENLVGMMRRGADPGHPVRVRTLCGELSAPEGPGVALEIWVESGGDNAETCFGAGAALGVESVRRIVEAHGGSFNIKFCDVESGDIESRGIESGELESGAHGVRVRIVFPADLCSRRVMLP